MLVKLPLSLLVCICSNSVGDHNGWHCCADIEISLIHQFHLRSGSDLKFIFILECHSTEQGYINERIQTHVGLIMQQQLFLKRSVHIHGIVCYRNVQLQLQMGLPKTLAAAISH